VGGSLPVIFTYAAVFGDLCGGGGVDDPRSWRHNDVWDRGILRRIAEPLSDEIATRDDIVNLESRTVAIKVFDCSLKVTLFLQEDKGNIVALLTRWLTLLLPPDLLDSAC
jgi:hypothetical protein